MNCHLSRADEEFLLKAEEHCSIRETTFHNIMNMEMYGLPCMSK